MNFNTISQLWRENIVAYFSPCTYAFSKVTCLSSCLNVYLTRRISSSNFRYATPYDFLCNNEIGPS